MAKAKKYRALVGLDYPDGKGETKRVEPGEDCSDVQKYTASIKVLIDQGAIEEVTDSGVSDLD